MRDNHLHTYFSYDSDTDFRDYLDNYTGEIVTTEHYDLSNPISHQDDIPDYEAYSQVIATLNAQYGSRIKRGIEIGYYQPREADILAFLADKTYNLKLLSVHHNGQYDYMEEVVKELDKYEVMARYFSELEYAIGRVPADVLAHFDYALRKIEVTVAELSQFEAQLKRIFQKMKANNLAFEINTKSMYLYGNEALYRYALQLIQEMGGCRISVGSDGHQLAHFRLGFDKVQQLLQAFGLTEEVLL